ncbi:MAG: hypothetical protein OEV85_12410 [Candidatus Thorarchaeota archaeon]|nr:hypothetical protein [Candidatus Thorarchaeota archaeon]
MKIKQNWHDYSLILSTIGMAQALILLPVAMMAYTGGSALDPDSPGFSLVYNFLSDLGRTVAYSGISNLKSSIIFNVSLFLAGVLLIPYFIEFPRIFDGTRVSRRFAILGSVIGIFFAMTFVGGSLTPSDRFMDIHLMFGGLAFVSGLPIVIFHTFAIISSPDYPNRYAGIYIALGAVLSIFLYSMYLIGDSGISVIVTFGQKFVVTSILICFLLLSLITRRISIAGK